MKLSILIVLFLIACDAMADVVIEITIPPRPITCPRPTPVPIRNQDGTYTLSPITYTTAQLCYDKGGSSHKEVWTDYPEKGGKFIRIVEE